MEKLQKNDIVNLSVVIPIFNEQKNIAPLYNALKVVLTQDLPDPNCEIIFIDDGSTDGSLEILKSIQTNDPKIKIVVLKRNFGQAAAISAGFDLAKGDIIVTMDGDLQNDPKDIPRLLKKLQEGYDVVSGWRSNRKDPLLTRKIPSYIANKLISKVTGVHLHDYGCTLKAYRAEVAKSIKLYGEMHRFIPALADWTGASVTEISVTHKPRVFGRSKYGLDRTIGVILDLIAVKFILTFFTRPMQIFGSLGLGTFTIGFLLGFYLSIEKFLHHAKIAGRPLLFLSVLLIFIGVQFMTLGLLAEISIRTYYESQNKPVYKIKEVIEGQT